MLRGINTFQFDMIFNSGHAEDYFEKKLINRNGGGRDNMTPQAYWQRFKGSTLNIILKCRNQEYKFSPYKEQLILKGRWKNPRCISIPTVRDRLVLGLLNEYLQIIFPECVNRSTPNQYIREIKEYIEANPGENRFFKSDFSQFYDNINQSLLIEKLRERIHDERPIKLIIDAIQNPTMGFKKEKKEYSLVGVPQGLAISNILSSIYMMDFDNKMKTLGAGLYLRYVDDILLLRPHFKDIESIIIDYLIGYNMCISLSKEKTVQGFVGDDSLDYIGYIFKRDCITVRENNVDLYIRRLAHAVTQLKRQQQNPAMRPRFIRDDNQLIEFHTEEINELVSGMKYESAMFGWLPYFQESTDLALFHRLDKILGRLLSKVANFDMSKLHSFVDSYHDIRERSGVHYVRNYDSLSSIAEKESFLMKKGWITATQHYSDDEINQMYGNYCSNRKKAIERNIGYFD